MAWQKVCSAETVPDGRLVGAEVQGVKVLLARIGGKFVAFPPLCPHMAEPLDISGVCDDGMLTCTKHLWQWDLASGEPRGEAEKALLCYPLRVDGSDVWIDFDGELKYHYDD